VRAFFVHKANAAARVAEQDEVLAEETHPQGWPVGLGNLCRKRRGNPVAAHQRAHRRPGADARQKLIFVLRQQGRTSMALSRERQLGFR
jgi:hypothetical protein